MQTEIDQAEVVAAADRMVAEKAVAAHYHIVAGTVLAGKEAVVEALMVVEIDLLKMVSAEEVEAV